LVKLVHCAVLSCATQAVDQKHLAQLLKDTGFDMMSPGFSLRAYASAAHQAILPNKARTTGEEVVTLIAGVGGALM
jgi:hypothetical protein